MHTAAANFSQRTPRGEREVLAVEPLLPVFLRQNISLLIPRGAGSHNLPQVLGDLSYHHRCPRGQGGNLDRSLVHNGRSQENFHSAETRTGQVPVHDTRQCLRTRQGGHLKETGETKREQEGQEGEVGERVNKGRVGRRPLTKAGGKVGTGAVSRRTDALEGAVSVGTDAALAKILLTALVHVCRTGHPKPRPTSSSA